MGGTITDILTAMLVGVITLAEAEEKIEEYVQDQISDAMAGDDL